jgi:hypothetical protein
VTETGKAPSKQAAEPATGISSPAATAPPASNAVSPSKTESPVVGPSTSITTATSSSATPAPVIPTASPSSTPAAAVATSTRTAEFVDNDVPVVNSEIVYCLYGAQLSELTGKGHTDVKRLSTLLNRFRGNVNAVIQHLATHPQGKEVDE